MKLRFSIRDLFWLVLVVAVALGWALDHRRLDNKIAELTSFEFHETPAPQHMLQHTLTK